MSETRKSQNWLDEQVRQLIGDGNVAHLRGAGKPLVWEDESLVPPEWQLAYRIMRQNNIAPEWIVLGQELYEEEARLKRIAANITRDYAARLQAAERKGSAVLDKEARARWQEARARWLALVEAYNKRLLTFNVSKPPQVAQRVPMDGDTLLREALRTYGL